MGTTESTGDEPGTRLDRFVAATDPAMVIVTTCVDDQPAGCLVGFHCQASIEPLRYAVWISTHNHTFQIARRAEYLGVHLVEVGDHHLAEKFGSRTGDDVDKFADIDWEAGPGGVPVLGDCPVRFVGRVVAVLDDGGDHVAFVLEPVASVPGSAPDGASVGLPLRLSAVGDITPGHP